MKILLLEDNVALNRAIIKILKKDEHEVSSFFSGAEVLNNENLFSYDLYILDINVPDINGLDVLKSIYDYNNQLKVIIISSNNDLKSIEKAYNYGCEDYLRKPFHIEELRLKIKKYLKKSKSYLDKIILKDNEKLTKMEKNFLLLLLKYEGEVVTYESIGNLLYDGKDMHISSLRTMVRRLRKKLVISKIENIVGEGYRYDM